MDNSSAQYTDNTSAQLMIEWKSGVNYKFRIGMKTHGCEYNLLFLSELVMHTAKEMRCVTKFKKRDLPTIKKVLNEVVELDHSKGWLFTTDKWEDGVPDYTAILDPATGIVGFYRGDGKDFIRSEEIPKVHRNWFGS